MGIRERVELDDVERSRQRILAAMLSENADEKLVKKAAVRQLMGTLIAARRRGLSFDKLAALMSECGIQIAPETLRGYFFDMKTDEELRTENANHAKSMGAARATLEKQQLTRNLQHAELVALNHVKGTSTKRQLVSAFATTETTTPETHVITESSIKAPSKQETNAVTAQQHHGSLEPLPTTRSATSDALTPSGVPQTIDQIEAYGQDKVRTELTENLFVDAAGYVITTSGKAFLGVLSVKQIHLLRTVGKLIAPSSGRSSKDFVQMPSQL